jgi:hypothetical protein
MTSLTNKFDLITDAIIELDWVGGGFLLEPVLGLSLGSV